MKKNLMLLIIFFIQFNLIAQNFINKQDSINFFCFYSKFSNIKLTNDSLKFDFPKINERIIDSNEIQNYICDLCNFCTNTYRYSTQIYNYGYSIETDKEFYCIIYFSRNLDPILKDGQIILTTFSKDNFKKIDKIVLEGYRECRYKISSFVSENFEIDTKTLFLYECDDIPYDEYPNFFWIDEIKSKYIIDDNGEIIKKFESDLQRYVGKISFDKYNKLIYVYPVIKNP